MTLHALFLRAWTTPGFAASVAADPRLAELAPDVVVIAGTTEGEHLCLTCQLVVPSVIATRDRLPNETLPANVRVVTIEGDAKLTLVLGEAHHVCLCAAPELEPIVFANWPG